MVERKLSFVKCFFKKITLPRGKSLGRAGCCIVYQRFLNHTVTSVINSLRGLPSNTKSSRSSADLK